MTHSRIYRPAGTPGSVEHFTVSGETKIVDLSAYRDSPEALINQAIREAEYADKARRLKAEREARVRKLRHFEVGVLEGLITIVLVVASMCAMGYSAILGSNTLLIGSVAMSVAFPLGRLIWKHITWRLRRDH